MGISIGCFKRLKNNQKSEIKNQNVDQILKPKSIIAASTDNQSTSTSTTLMLNQKLPLNEFQNEFDMANFQSIFLGFPTSINNDLQLTLPMIGAVERIFDLIDRDLVATAKKIHICTMMLGKSVKEKFAQSAQDAENVFKYESSDDRMLAHIISYVKYHKLLIELFKKDMKEAKRCLNLMIFGHIQLKVNQSDFKMFDVAIEKFLLKYYTIDENDLKVTVSYLNLITNYICHYIRQYNDNESLNEFIKDDVLLKKETSKQMRKWNVLKGKLRFETCPFIEEALETKNIFDPGRRKTVDIMCPLSNIDCIYSYTNKFNKFSNK